MATSSAPLTTKRRSSGTSQAASARHPTGSPRSRTLPRGIARMVRGGAGARRSIGGRPGLGAPGDEMIEAEVPDGGNAGADEVGHQVVEPDLVVQVEEHPVVDQEAAGVDRPVEEAPGQDAATAPVVPG